MIVNEIYPLESCGMQAEDTSSTGGYLGRDKASTGHVLSRSAFSQTLSGRPLMSSSFCVGT